MRPAAFLLLTAVFSTSTLRGAEPPPTVAAARANHWSFRAVSKPAGPTVKARDWVRTPIDAFVLARLEAEGLAPAPEADRRTLIRRVYFDLLGLPPTPEEVDTFVADHCADAYDKVVDRLLASPQYGERWGRHWLDVARYADTKGYVFTEERRYPYPRLRHPRVQRGPAVRPVHFATARRRPAAAPR